MDDFFRARPPARRLRQTFPILRSSKTKNCTLSFKVLAIGDRVHCAPIHYQGRSTPCMQPFDLPCKSCDAGYEPRWVGYFAGYTSKHSRCLVELTADAAELLAAEAERRGSIRGLAIIVSRVGDRANGPMKIDWRPADIPSEQIPESFAVTEPLAQMWRIKQHLLEAEAYRLKQLPMDPRISGDLYADTFKMNGKKRGTA